MKSENKTPYVLVHGMFGNGSQWGPIANELRGQGHMVVTPTLIGHREGNMEEEFTVDNVSIIDYCRQIESTIRRLKFGSCNLVGHSMGGLIAQVVAKTMPYHVEKVVLIGSVAPKGIFPLTWATLWRLAIKPRYVKAMITGSGYNIYDKDARALFMNNISSDVTSEKWFSSKESGLATGQIAYGKIKVAPLHQPTMVIGAGLDRVTPPSMQKKIAALHQNSHYIEFPDRGHMLMVEKGFQEVVQSIDDWVNTSTTKKVSLPTKKSK